MPETEKQESKPEPEKQKAKPEKRPKFKSFSERFGDGEFYPDLPKVDFKTLVGLGIIVWEAKILRNFRSEFGIHDAGLMLCSPIENEFEQFTTINSGTVVLERLERAIKERALPMTAVVHYVNDTYYNLL